MSLKFVVQEITVEDVVKGRNRYQVANVVHTYNGQSRTQKIMSFANPGVFAQLQTVKPGDSINVEITKNDAGYNQWSKLVADDPSTPQQGASVPGKAAPTGGKTTNSTYETREERAARQVLIVRQSCLAQALAYYAMLPNSDVDTGSVLDTAQDFVNWVFAKPDLFDQPNDDVDNPA